MFTANPFIRILILLLAGIQLCSFLAGSLVLLANVPRAAWLALALAGLSLLSVLCAAVFLVARYLRTPVTQKKRTLEFQKRKLQKEIQAAVKWTDLSGQTGTGEAEDVDMEAHSAALLANLVRLEGKIQDRLGDYAQVSFRGFLGDSLALGKPGSRRSRRWLAGGLIGLAALSPLAQAGLGAAAAVSILNGSTPLAPAAARRAATLPSTEIAPQVLAFTPTPFPTQSPSPIRTPTLAPTASLTSTSTPSLTDTPLPSGTPTPSETPFPTATSTESTLSCLPPDTPRQAARVVRVIDGDTIEVRLENKKRRRVRYIGMDTPDQGDPGFWDAMNQNSQLVDGRDVLLVQDVSETDRYDRLLRYVLVGDLFVNYELVARGVAQVSTYPPDVACAETFARAQDQAVLKEAGLWGATQPPPPERGPERAGCDPAYPDVCISSPPPDLDCGDITHRRFRVLSPDPHRFDGDGDGIGCEG